MILKKAAHLKLNGLILGTAFQLLLCLTVNAVAGEFPAQDAREISAIRARIRAAQFLSKATFGPTEETIDSLAGRITQVGYRRACSEWIDHQFAIAASSQEQVARDMVALAGLQPDSQLVGMADYRYQVWWHIALDRPDQLRQRVAWALAQIFVVSHSVDGFNNDQKRSIGGGEFSITDWLGLGNYYDILIRNASGNYRDLLGEVTFHPCMGAYLSSLQNRKADLALGRFPDENFAREVMQLFSIGLYELHQDGRLKFDEQNQLIPTYDNDGIKELARLFTGFRFFHHESTKLGSPRNFGDPMQVFAEEHDNNLNYAEDPNAPGQPDPNAPQSKTVLGVTLSPLPTPLTNAAATAEINEGLDVIANHENVPPFICRLLIQRLVKSNPSRAYLRRVTRKFRDNGHGVRGDMKAVIKAILLDAEAIRGQRLVRIRANTPNPGDPPRISVVTRGTEHCRLREPIIRLAAWVRAMRPTSNYQYNDPETGRPYMMLNQTVEPHIGQLPYRAPNVFNYYLPDFQPAGPLVSYQPSQRIPREALFAPEFQILTAVTANKFVNRIIFWGLRRQINHHVRGGVCAIDFHLEDEQELLKSNSNLPEVIRRFDLLLCNGSMSKETIANITNSITSESTVIGQNILRLESLLIAILISPDCAIEE